MKADIELIQEVLSGNRQAFSELVQRHQRAVLRLSFRFTRDASLAEDIVQEGFLKAYQKLHLFEGRSSFKSWLYQIVINTAKNRLRAMDPEPVSLDETHLGIDPGAETGMLKMDLRRFIRTEIDKLPLRQRMAISLRIFEDLSFKEIAVIMECPYDTAKANYRHALLKLKDVLEEQGQTIAWDGIERTMQFETGRMLTEAEQ